MNKCEKCGHIYKRGKHIAYYKGFYLCHLCKPNKMPMNRNKTSLEKALSKTYKVHSYINKNGVLTCSLSLPSVFSKKYVRLLLDGKE